MNVRLAEHDELPQSVWEGLYGEFKEFAEDDPRNDIYQVHTSNHFNTESVFHSVDRLKLIKAMMESEYAFDGANLPLSTYLFDSMHPLIAFYPLHNEERKINLKKQMVTCKAIFYPPPEIRNYFGEQIAMYFNFLSMYMWWLMIPGILYVCIYVFMYLCIYVFLNVVLG